VRTPSTGNASLPGQQDEPIDKDAKTRRPDSTTRANVAGRPAPRMPHERDESSDDGTGAPSDMIQRAADDVATGKKPTDKGEATEDTYRRSLRGKTPGAERD
jgi:hypothetical protein